MPHKLWEDVQRMHALKLLGSYLTSTTVAPLMDAMVNVPSPYATDVDVDTLFFSDPAITVDFENVPMDRMKQVVQLGICMKKIHMEFHIMRV